MTKRTIATKPGQPNIEKEMTAGQVAAIEGERSSAREAQKKKALNSHADAVMHGGITLNGLFVSTSENSLVKISGAVTRAMIENDPGKTHIYHPPGAAQIILSNADFLSIGLATAAHVQKVLDVKNSINLSDYERADDAITAFDQAFQSA